MNNLSEKQRGMLWMLLACILFAIFDSLSKYLVHFYPVAEVVWIRYFVHMLLMLVWFAPRRGMSLIRTRQPGLQLLRALSLLASSLFVVSGLQRLPLAEATAIIFLSPLLITALSVPVLGDKVDGKEWIAVCAGFVGVLIIVRPGSGLLTPAALLPLGGALTNSVYQLMTRKLSATENPITTNFILSVVGALVLGITVPFIWEWPTLPHACLMLLLGALALIGHAALIAALTHATTGTLMPFSYTQLLWASVLGFVIFGSFPDWGTIIGMVVIAGSGLYIMIHHAAQSGSNARGIAQKPRG